MLIHPVAAAKKIIDPKKYRTEIVKKYDHYSGIINLPDQPELTEKVFDEFGIRTVADLGKYLRRNSEYGGYIRFPGSERNILIPFHNDFMNKWLRFDNPRIVRFYDRIYELRKDEFNNRHHFDMERFNIEEEFQLNNWRMPTIDRRMLSAPINGCWDKPELLARFLSLKGYQIQRMSCNDGNILRGHCFCVYYDGTFWRTASSYGVDLKKRDYREFARSLLGILRHVPIFSDNSKCRIMEFEAPDKNCTGKEYVRTISEGHILAE